MDVRTNKIFKYGIPFSSYSEYILPVININQGMLDGQVGVGVLPIFAPLWEVWYLGFWLQGVEAGQDRVQLVALEEAS